MEKEILDESGQGMVEYGLLIGLIALAVVAAIMLLGPMVKGFFSEVDEIFSSAISNSVD